MEWVTIPFSGDLPNSGIKPRFSALQVDSLTAPTVALGTCFSGGLGLRLRDPALGFLRGNWKPIAL